MKNIKKQMFISNFTYMLLFFLPMQKNSTNDEMNLKMRGEELIQPKS